jgi:hypothetical protein
MYWKTGAGFCNVNTLHRFIKEQLSLEAEAREALPYASALSYTMRFAI